MQREKSIGLIGVGLLGSAIAERLLGAGFDVVGFDRNADAQARLNELGGISTNSAHDVAHECEHIVFCLPNSRIAASVVDEILPALTGNPLVIDTTTGDPKEMIAIAGRLAERGVEYIDATVGGSSEQARQGDAICMVGGTREAFELASGLLHTFARQVFHLGAVGSGARMKLVVNLVLGLNRAVLAEGLGFARTLGLSLEDALQVLQAGPAASAAANVKGRKMIEGDFTPQARLSQHLKDVRLILDQAAHARLPFTTIHARLLEELEQAGRGDQDNSAIASWFLS